MADDRFDYTEVLKSDMSGVVTSIIAHQAQADAPLRAVLWSALHQAWISAPGTAAGLLYDDENFDRLRNVDRSTAKLAAREALAVELPDEGKLTSIAEEGERMGWDFGPPRRP
jgi:pyruvoyl-dependent arginine decarboxylase (PvlArgDC)